MMNDIKRPEDDAGTGSDVDPGEPIRDLADLEDAASARFFQRLVDRIDRRLLGGDMVDLARGAIREFFLAYWNLVVSVIARGGKDDGGARQ